MEMKKMLVSVLTTAVGFSLGLMVYNRFMSVTPMMKQGKATTEESTTEEEGE